MNELEIVIFRVVENKDSKPMAYFKLQNGLKFRYMFDTDYRQFSITDMVQEINFKASKHLPNCNLLLKIDEFCPIQKVNKDIYKKVLFNTTELQG